MILLKYPFVKRLKYNCYFSNIMSIPFNVYALNRDYYVCMTCILFAQSMHNFGQFCISFFFVQFWSFCVYVSVCILMAQYICCCCCCCSHSTVHNIWLINGFGRMTPYIYNVTIPKKRSKFHVQNWIVILCWPYALIFKPFDVHFFVYGEPKQKTPSKRHN